MKGYDIRTVITLGNDSVFYETDAYDMYSSDEKFLVKFSTFKPYHKIFLYQDGTSVILNGERDTPKIIAEDDLFTPNGNDNSRACILWNVSIQYRQDVQIKGGEFVKIEFGERVYVAGNGRLPSDSLSSMAEITAFLKPGQELRVRCSGPRVRKIASLLKWDGENIRVTFGDSTMFDPISEEGDYI